MISVVYDYQIFQFQRYGGVSRYVYELARRVGGAEDFSARIIAPLYVNAYIDRREVNIFGLCVPPPRRRARARSLFNHGLSLLACSAARPHLVHETYFNRWSIAPPGVPKVVTVHDMIHEKYPESFATDEWASTIQRASAAKRQAVERADRVICVSENTRRDLIDFFAVAPEKAVTIHHGVSLLPPGEEAACAGAERPYLLYVGTRATYKNFDRLLQAYAAAPRLRREFNLLAFGGGPFTEPERERLRQLRLSDTWVRQVAGDDRLLARCYRGAAAFVCPSLYEGFGIPPLEAMQLGCPVVSSSTSSLPEVVGDAAELFNPMQPEAIRAAIEAVVFSPTRRRELVERGARRIRSFTWESCAERTMSIYRELTGR